MKKILLIATGVFIGVTLVLTELFKERLIVTNDLDGSVTLRHTKATQTLKMTPRINAE